MAVRDSQDTAPAMGINPRRTKVLLFTLSAFFCGLAGYVFAFYWGMVEPASFDFSLSLFFFAAVVVGGMASIWGSLIGAAVLVVMQQESLCRAGLLRGDPRGGRGHRAAGGARRPGRCAAARARRGPRIARRPRLAAATGGGPPDQPPAPSSPAGASREG